jgi:hypothetical protein
VRHFWIFAHLLGFVLWLGGGLAAMTLGLALKRAPREQLGPGVRQLAMLYQKLLLPGSVLTVASGLVLTMIIFGSAGTTAVMSRSLMTMQGVGLAAALVTLLVLVPNAGRLVRLDPIGQAEPFDAARRRQARMGMISGLLGLIALAAGAIGRP